MGGGALEGLDGQDMNYVYPARISTGGTVSCLRYLKDGFIKQWALHGTEGLLD